MSEQAKALIHRLFKALQARYPKCDTLTLQSFAIFAGVALLLAIGAAFLQRWLLVGSLLTSLLICHISLMLLVQDWTSRQQRLGLFVGLLVVIMGMAVLDKFESPFYIYYFILLFLPRQAFPEDRALFLSSLALLCAAFLISAYLNLAQDKPLTPEALYFSVWLLFTAMLAAIFASLTAVVANNKAVEQLQIQLRDINLRYKNLLRVACHDLSNPLTLIMGSAQIAQGQSFQNTPEKALIFWGKVEKAAEKINGLITNFRVYEAMQPPKRLVYQEVRLLSLLDELGLAFHEQLCQQNLKLLSDHRLAPESTVVIDPHFFMISCLKKVMANAIKYSPQGGSILLQSYQEGDLAYIIFQDQGPGIEPEILNNLFHFDFMEQHVSEPGQKGSGFGLAVAKLLLREFDGDLEVSSSKTGEKGTRVKISLSLSFQGRDLELEGH